MNATDRWAGIPGQPEAVALLEGAVRQPVHAYMFRGPRGSGKRAAAAIFAGELIAEGLDGDAARRARDLARREQHPDLVVVEPEGRALRVEEAVAVIAEASTAPVESDRKVVVCDRFHTAEMAVAPRLLKTIEEPPGPTTFVLISEDVPAEQATIASRCVTVDFHPLAEETIRTVLESEGVESDRAAVVAAASLGDLGRARRLAADEAVGDRRALWYSLPERLDGAGSAVAVLVAEIREGIDGAQEAVEARQAGEREEMAEREEAYGARGSGRREMEARHKRELRAVRDDELRFGLATLAGAYRDQADKLPADALAGALGRISGMGEWLTRNPNETLVLQALLLDLSGFRDF